MVNVPEAYTNGEGGRNPLRFLCVFSPIFPELKNYILSQRFDFINRIRRMKKGGLTILDLTILDPIADLGNKETRVGS